MFIRAQENLLHCCKEAGKSLVGLNPGTQRQEADAMANQRFALGDGPVCQWHAHRYILLA